MAPDTVAGIGEPPDHCWGDYLKRRGRSPRLAVPDLAAVGGGEKVRTEKEAVLGIRENKV